MKKQLVQLISQEEIAVTVNRLAKELDRDYENRSLLLVGILKGSFIFLADLVRKINTTICNIEFISISSYGASTVTSGQATIIMGLPKEKVMGQDVIVVEDIVDTGITTATVLNYLKNYDPASLRLCTLLNKPARRQIPVTIDYLGFTVPDCFIVGYGIDFNQEYRQLPAIYALEE
ncbi:hypoxanthine phosphoribosyltransferase [Scytonema sp. UIC 10036]|uniref:hypoxanthine phosphoribosyltransferase n=1 Tax=Scytonema sp. UIC 10036 TaxID=2304196 RepID=UPI0012DA83C0|nr:hypoxanthine phosphoribosyltransferase [Scytonema sp. UIC 10036]MUG93582.1 hypoxanthine phosphoribosyltransferase [Scytonema sp. UIC 10036]